MIFIILIIIVLICVIRIKSNASFAVKQFEYQNCIVFGKKRTGKDLFFQYVINKRNIPNYANQTYGKKTIVESIKSLSVEPNTFENCIHNKISVVPPTLKPYHDFYISDGGIFLPCQYNNILNKLYPSFPIYYALSGQIRAMNIHINVQALNRLWDKIREQADYYFKTSFTIKLPFYFAVRVTAYSDYEDALNNLKPLKISLFSNKFEKGMKRVENSARGDIRSFWIFMRKKDIKYDTHFFEKVFYGSDACLHIPRRKYLRSLITNEKDKSLSNNNS